MAMNWQVKKEMVLDAAEKIKSYGYRVFLVEDDRFGSYYGYFSDGNNVGYFQVDWYAYSVSKCIAPSISVIDGLRDKETQITREICEHALSDNIPYHGLKYKPRLHKLDELLNRYKDSEYFKEI